MGDDDPKPTNSDDPNDEQADHEPPPGPDDDAGTVEAEADQAEEPSDRDPGESPDSSRSDIVFFPGATGSSGLDQDVVRSWERQEERDRQAAARREASDRRAGFQREREGRRARVARGDKKYSEARVEAERRRRFINAGALVPLSGAVILGLAVAGLFVLLSGGGDSTEDAATNGANGPAPADQTQEPSETPTDVGGDETPNANEAGSDAPDSVSAGDGQPPEGDGGSDGDSPQPGVDSQISDVRSGVWDGEGFVLIGLKDLVDQSHEYMVEFGSNENDRIIAGFRPSDGFSTSLCIGETPSCLEGIFPIGGEIVGNNDAVVFLFEVDAFANSTGVCICASIKTEPDESPLPVGCQVQVELGSEEFDPFA